MKKIMQSTVLAMFGIALLLPAANALAKKSAEALAKEGEEFSAATAKDKPTPELVMEKVNKAALLLEKEGKAAFPKFKGKNSEFIFGGTYIWIHDMNGIMRMHPIKYKMEGQHLIGLKDINGKRFFTVMNKVAKEKGSGWVDYMWPKPGETTQSQKVSYVKYCKVDNEEMVLGCGIYDLSAEEISRLTK